MSLGTLLLTFALAFFLNLGWGCRPSPPPDPQPSIKGVDDFFHYHFQRWISVFDVQVKNDHFVNSGEFIAGPEKTWQYLLKLQYLGPENFRKLSACLFFRLPAQSISQKKFPLQVPKSLVPLFGEIRVVEMEEDKPCQEAFLQNQNTAKSLGYVVNLKVRLNPHHLLFQMEVLDPSQEALVTRSMEFPLYNLKKGQLLPPTGRKFKASPRVAERYHSSVEQKLVPGLTVFPLKRETDNVQRGTLPPLLGSFEDSYPDDKFVKCHEVNDECETVQEFTCDRCRYGWYEVVGSECPRGGTKICGVNRCGESKWPACPRGNILSSSRGMLQCQNGSLSGYCQNDEETFCDENRVLICL